MKEYKKSYLTWLFIIICSVCFGDMTLMILEKTPLNIWVSRIIGCLVCVLFNMLFCIMFYNNKKEN
ncbi:MAG: hypothetical protein IIZ40_02310 [Bacilli bacterium]|nr:hypothetical protein [Bacilli bacterium]